MRRCSSCGGEVAGEWSACPLCRVNLDPADAAALAGAEVFPAPLLRFDRRQVWAAVLALSVLVLIFSFAAPALVPGLAPPVRTVWLSIAVVWLVVIAAVQRRRNVGSLVGWLVVLLSVAAVVWNQYDGPDFWATTWVIPAICTAANLALGRHRVDHPPRPAGAPGEGAARRPDRPGAGVVRHLRLGGNPAAGIDLCGLQRAGGVTDPHHPATPARLSAATAAASLVFCVQPGWWAGTATVAT